MTGTKVTSAKPTDKDVTIEAQLPDGKTEKITADYLLVATGRGPVTTGVGAEELGLKMDRGYIIVDELFRTSVPGISAVGDVITFGPGKKPHAQLAHLSSAEGILLAERIAGHDVRPINYDHVPGCTYCDPEIGSVGLTEAQAKEKRLRRAHRLVPVQGAGPRAHGERDRRLREDRGREEVRRDSRRPHHRPARDGNHRRGDDDAADGVHGRGADSHDPCASDDVGSDGRGGARAARRAASTCRG